MKKGKPNVPPQMRANYRAQQAQSSERESMMAASRMGEDGLPVFNLFVRTPTANVSFRWKVFSYRPVAHHVLFTV
jgi:hypothetical protein